MSILTIGNDRRGADPVPRPGEIARGDYWSIVREGDDYVLCYLSSELLGRERRLQLHEREARDIADGRTPVEFYLTQQSAALALSAPKAGLSNLPIAAGDRG